LQNLLANAIKFVPEGRTPSVRVTAETVGADVVLRIVDNGVGIDPAHRTKVFDMFHRASPAEFTGTGLGLAIVKKIVTRHGGGIWIEDAPAATGAAVCVRLPAAAGGE
jgi:signal transduction histidine kinase